MPRPTARVLPVVVLVAGATGLAFGVAQKFDVATALIVTGVLAIAVGLVWDVE